MTPQQFHGEQWKPSNSDAAQAFFLSWCANCQRDKAMREGVPLDDCDDNECCDIIAASFRGEAVEWRRLPDGQVKCLAFVPAGEPLPAPRCTQTPDMFGDVA